MELHEDGQPPDLLHSYVEAHFHVGWISQRLRAHHGFVGQTPQSRSFLGQVHLELPSSRQISDVVRESGGVCRKQLDLSQQEEEGSVGY